MRIDRRDKFDAPPPSSGGPITAKNYIERAIAAMRQSGRSNGDHPVIRTLEGKSGARATGKQETAEQWRAWMAYFARIGYPTLAAQELGVMTVPAHWPWEFDRSAPEIIPAPAPPPRRAAPADCDEIRAKFDGLREHFGRIPRDPRRPDRKPPAPPVVDPSAPLRLSPAALASVGAGADQDEEQNL